MRFSQRLGPLLVAIIESRGVTGASVDENSSLSCGLDNHACDDSDSETTTIDDILKNLTPDSSITEFLNPKLLDEQVLADIKSKVMSGHLVVIRDAFIPEFAEYVWEQLSRDEENKYSHAQYYSPLPDSPEVILMENIDNGNETNLQFFRDKLKSTTKARRTLAEQNWKLGYNPDSSKLSERKLGARGNKLGIDFDSSGHNTRKLKIFPQHEQSPEMLAAKKVFESMTTKKFLTESISGRSCLGKSNPSSAEYARGDYSSPHTDFRDSRSLDIVWHLAKEWDPKWGGAFYWGGAQTLEEGYHYPTFNTAILFQPTATSSHFVSPVNPLSKGHRLSFTWKYRSHINMNTYDDFNKTEAIERLFGKKEDRIHLTFNEAIWIAGDLDPETYTTDPQRQQRLRDIKQSVRDEYLHPQEKLPFVVSWEEDGKDDGPNIDDKVELPIAGTKGISITAESSILDFLDPDILEDTELIAEIGENLRKGKLVVIQDAFRADFAEYTQKLLDQDDVAWEKKEVFPSVVPGSSSSKHIASSYSTELAGVLGVFEHAKTKEFLEGISGRSCSGSGLRLRPTWYKRNDHSNPRHDAEFSVQLEWNLAKHWDPTWGGDLFWFPPRTMEGGYQHATFNTLLLSLPTPSSIYLVTPVTWWAEGKHFSISASYSAEEHQFTSEDQIEEIFGNEEDYIGLTEQQAKWIVHDMEAGKMTNDPVRLQKLLELKENIATKYLYPSSGEVHEFEFM